MEAPVVTGITESNRKQADRYSECAVGAVRKGDVAAFLDSNL